MAIFGRAAAFVDAAANTRVEVDYSCEDLRSTAPGWDYVLPATPPHNSAAQELFGHFSTRVVIPKRTITQSSRSAPRKVMGQSATKKEATQVKSSIPIPQNVLSLADNVRGIGTTVRRALSE